MNRLNELILKACCSPGFSGWVLEWDDDYWFVRISQRPLVLMMLYIGLRAVMPIVSFYLSEAVKSLLLFILFALLIHRT